MALKRYKRKRKVTPAGAFKPGHAPTPGGGRPPGSQNLLGKNVKEAILEAMARFGSDGQGKEGMIGYFFSMCEDKVLMCRLAEKILPIQTQVSGPGEGPVQVLHIPPEVLLGFPPEELRVLENALARLSVDTIQHTVEAKLPVAEEANDYADLIGAEDPGVRH